MNSLKSALSAVGIKSFDTSNWYKVVFVQKLIVAERSYSHGYSNCNRYTVAVEKDNKKYLIRLADHYRDCYSGWTCATEAGYSVEQVYDFKGIQQHLLPKEDILIQIVEKENSTIFENIYGENVFTIWNNGDEYYPSGGLSFEGKHLFNETNRYTNKRKTFLVTGSSGMGKSSLFPEGLELESLREIDKKCLKKLIQTEKTIIISPYSEKHVIQTKKIIEYLEEDPLIEIIMVNLS